MRLDSLNLINFRGYSSFQTSFSPDVTVIVGANGSGKTALIEAIYLICNGDSFRAQKIEDMISLGQELARVEGTLIDPADKASSDQSEKTSLEVMLTRGQVQGKSTAKRLFSINSVRRTKNAARSLLHAVVFRPEDMRLVEGSPARRRDWLDSCLAGLFADYHNSLSVYQRALLTRNKLLWQIREGEQPRTALAYYTLQLIKHGQILQDKRQEFFQFFASVVFPVAFHVSYLPSVISQDRMDQYAQKEIAAGHTLIGPHKDDFLITLPPELLRLPTKSHASLRGQADDPTLDLAVYGSRGQQRLGVLWLKLCELAYVEARSGQKVLLLLDDILSELDTHARGLILGLMQSRQTILTTASHGLAERVEGSFKKVKKVKL